MGSGTSVGVPAAALNACSGPASRQMLRYTGFVTLRTLEEAEKPPHRLVELAIPLTPAEVHHAAVPFPPLRLPFSHRRSAT